MYIACSFIIHFIYSNSIPECIRQPIRSTLFTLKKTTMPKVYFDLTPQRDQRLFAKILETILELERTISWNTEYSRCVQTLQRVHRLRTNLHEFNLFAVYGQRSSLENLFENKNPYLLDWKRIYITEIYKKVDYNKYIMVHV